MFRKLSHFLTARRTLATILSFAFVAISCAVLLPMITHADAVIYYYDEKGGILGCSAYSYVSADNLTWDDGWYVVSGEVVSSGRFICSGNVHLILLDGCNLQAADGISVNTGNSLTVYAGGADRKPLKTGKLEAKRLSGYDYAASIGGELGIGNGAITINGGNITADGSNCSSSSGIGSGGNGNAADITIHGGKVKAVGGENAAGIGTGYNGTASNITITGGEVIAKGGENAAGIGGGYFGAVSGIYIKGGTVNATGGDGAAGIGSGSYAQELECSNIEISGGNVSAYGGNSGAGIGGSFLLGKVKNITISGGVIMAIGGVKAAGIGGADDCEVTDITITGGVIEAHAGDRGAGIGSGWGGTATNISLLGGKITAQSDDIEIPAIGSVGNESRDDNVTVAESEMYIVSLRGEGGEVIYPAGSRTESFAAAGIMSSFKMKPVTVYYMDENGESRTCDTYTVLMDGMTAWNDRLYVVNGDITISSRIPCTGDVRLILLDGCKLTAKAGIQVAGEKNGLTVYAGGLTKEIMQTGALYAEAKENRAAIGGDSSEDANNITINGGTITAIGKGDYCPGIGAGSYVRLQDITINGGNIYAQGGKKAPGIGCIHNEIRNFTINGGMVTAVGGENASGIGVGAGNLDLTVNGGTLTVEGETGAPGLGVGLSQTNVILNGGSISVTGGEGACSVGSGNALITVTDSVEYVVLYGDDAADTPIPAADRRTDFIKVTGRYFRMYPTPDPTEVTIDPSPLSLRMGQSKILTAAVKPADTVQDIVWKSDDEEIAVVSADGTVFGIDVGETTITATSDYLSTVYATCKVTVLPKDISSFSVEAQDAVFTGSAYAGTVTVSGLDGEMPASIYTLKYFDSEGTELSGAPKDVGEYKVAAVGVNSQKYDGMTAPALFKITQASVKVTPKDGSKIYGETDPALQADITGLFGTDTVSYSLSREPGEDAGTYKISASGLQSQGNYTVTCGSDATFTVNRRGVGLKPNDIEKHIGGETPALTYQADGLVGSDSLSGVTLSVGSGEDAVGKHEITAVWDSTKDPNYDVTINGKGTLTVTDHVWNYTAAGNVITATCGTDGCQYHTGSALQVVLTAPQDAVYNGTAYSASFTDTISAATGAALPEVEYRNASDEKVPSAIDAGSYTACISVGGKTAAASFTVAQVPVTVTAKNGSKKYGEIDPALQADVAGLVGSDTITYTLEREEGSNVGKYGITASGEANQGNYTVTYTGAEFTIARKQITVAPDNLGKHIGDPTPDLTYTAKGLVGEDELTGISLSVDGNPDELGTHTVTAVWDETADPNYEVEITGTSLLVVSDHAWSYSAEGNVITARCEAEGCQYHQGGADENALQVVLTLPEEAVYSGAAFVPSYTNTVTEKTGAQVYIEIRKGEQNVEDAVQAGDYTVVMTVGDASVSGKFTVAQAPVTVKARNGSKIFGSRDPELTAEVTGLIGDDTVTYTLTRAEGENAGTYAIIASGDASQGNYALAFTDGTFTVEPRNIDGAVITLDGEVLTYDGKPKFQKISCVTLDKGDEGKWTVDTYTITNNSDCATDEGKNVLTIVGTGNFTGTASAYWYILGEKIPDEIKLQINRSDKGVTVGISDSSFAAAFMKADDMAKLTDKEKPDNLILEIDNPKLSEKEVLQLQECFPKDKQDFVQIDKYAINVKLKNDRDDKDLSLYGKITVSIQLPDNFKNKNGDLKEHTFESGKIKVLNKYNGFWEAVDFSYDEENNQIVFDSDQLGVFALAYIDEPDGESESSEPVPAGDSDTVVIFALLAVLSVVTAGAVIGRRRRKNWQ